MQIDIQAHGFTLTDGIHEYVLKRLAYSLNHGDENIMRVKVRLSDINGPRGGEDKRCLIGVRLKGTPEVIIEDTESDLYVAIDHATERAGHSLARRLARQRSFAPGVSPDVQEIGGASGLGDEVGNQPGAPCP